MTQQLLHPLRVVAQRTGLTPDLLRAWERRYAVVQPSRSAGGQRLYSDQDIEHLGCLHRAVLAGRAIGQVALLGRAELARLVAGDSAPVSVPPPALSDDTRSDIERSLAECLAAILRIDGLALESALKRAALEHSVPVLLDQLLVPLLRDIGDQWEAGTMQPIHEHAASVEIHKILSWLIHRAQAAPSAPVVAVTTPAGQAIELGALMVAASAAAEGWRVVWLGPNLPSADILLGVDTLSPSVLAISLVHQSRDADLHRELERIARGVSGRCALLVGGRGAQPHALHLERHGAVVMSDLASFRVWLRRHRAM